MEPKSELTQDLILACPQCGQLVAIQQLNCRIFRHASYKLTGEQIPPHTPQAECERLVQGELIYGCGKPFQIVENENIYVAVICGYI